MNKETYIIFDFDGTLADTLEMGIRIYNEIAPLYRTFPIDANNIERFKELSTKELFDIHKVALWKLPFMLFHLKKKLKKRTKDIQLFEGIVELIQQLKKQGYRLGIMSSNSIENIRAILQREQQLQHFDFIFSSRNIFGKDKKMKQLLKQKNINASNIVYVGDETRDIDAMHLLGIPIITVAWGFHHPDKLLKKSPFALVNTPQDLYHKLCKFN